MFNEDLNRLPPGTLFKAWPICGYRCFSNFDKISIWELDKLGRVVTSGQKRFNVSPLGEAVEIEEPEAARVEPGSIGLLLQLKVAFPPNKGPDFWRAYAPKQSVWFIHYLCPAGCLYRFIGEDELRSALTLIVP